MTATNVVDPNDPMSQTEEYIREWQEANDRFQQDQSALAGMFATLAGMMKAGKTEEAMMYAQMAILPGALSMQGDQTAIMGATENVASGLRSFGTDIQNLFNEGAGLAQDDDASTPEGWIKFQKDFGADAAKMANEFNQLRLLLNGGSNDGSPAPWISDSTRTTMNQAMDTFLKQFGSEGGREGDLGPLSVMIGIRNWFPKTQQTTPAPEIAAVQGSFQTLNNAVSAQQSSTTTQEQYWANVFKQMEGLMTNMYQATSKQDQVMIQNANTH